MGMQTQTHAQESNSVMKWLWLSGGVAACDQASKAVATAFLAPGDVVAVMPGVNLVLVHNTGAAFSLLASAGGWQRWFLLALALAVCAFLFAWLRRLSPSETRAAVGIAFLIGGAAGNIIDRVFLGYVVDFIDVSYANYHWPAFNVADSAITLGAGLVIWSAWSK